MSSSTHGVAQRNGDRTPLGETVPGGKFGRMFPALGPLVPEAGALQELGEAMVESTAGAITGDNDLLPAGYTYLGQFLDHDITFDPTSLSESVVDPLALRNFRTPAFDLDCLYGAGPRDQPYLYQRVDSALFQIGATSRLPGTGDPGVAVSQPFDLPRAPHGLALIGDPRNDENLIVAQLHLAFLRFHNKVVEALRNGTAARVSPIRKADFEEARDLVVRHYQWILLNDYLPRVADPEVLETVRTNGSSLFGSGEPYIPVEFSAAAYRFGHSMVRPAYDQNRVFRQGGVMPATLSLLFRFSGRSGRGDSVPIPSDWIIDWRRFFGFGVDGLPVNLSRLIDPYLSDVLAKFPAGPGATLHLAVQNLKRGASLGLPPAQSILRFLKMTPLAADEIASSGPDGAIAARHGFHIETPLWYYILKEAQLRAGAQRLGPLGSRIVAEVFIGLLEHDSASFLLRDPDWKPTLGPRPGEFTMTDMLNFAGDLNPIG